MKNRVGRVAPAFLVVFAAFVRTVGQTGPTALKPGDLAPPLTVNKLLYAQGRAQQLSARELKGNAVVVEFWATWCSPCVASIPHLNALADEFSNGRLIRFVSITDEDESIVAKFLTVHPMAGWVALDPQQNTFKAFGVNSRPHTVLIDAKGVIRAVTTPEGIAKQTLEDLIAGKNVTPVVTSVTWARMGTEPTAPVPFFQVLIRPAASEAINPNSPGIMRQEGDTIELWKVSLSRILSSAYGVPRWRIELPREFDEAQYDLSVTVPHGQDSGRWELVRQALPSTFGITVRREIREPDVYILQKRANEASKLRTPATRLNQVKLRDRQLVFLGVPVSLLASELQRLLKTPVLDETGLRGAYDFELSWQSPDSIGDEVRQQLGLELTAAKRKFEFLVVEAREKIRPPGDEHPND